MSARIARLTHRLIVAVATLSLSTCGSDRDSPTSPTPPVQGQCGEGPLSVGVPGCGASPQGSCPIAAPADATALLMAATCSYGEGGTDCSPVPSICGRGSLRFQAQLVSPGPPPSVCGGEVLVVADSHRGEVAWEAMDMAATPAGGCVGVGPIRTGNVPLSPPCCTTLAAIPFRDFTFKIAIQRDWTR